MKFRSMILVLTIAFSAIFLSMLGTSYAYYVSADGTSIDVTTGNIDTGTVVTFEESEYININNAIPGKTYSNYFTIIPNKEILGDDYIINIGITDIYIDEELKTNDFQLKLFCEITFFDRNDLAFPSLDYNGRDFTDDVLSNDFLLLADTFITLDEHVKDLYCYVTVELKETGENQNHLMNKKFRGLIKVNTLFK